MKIINTVFCEKILNVDNNRHALINVLRGHITPINHGPNMAAMVEAYLEIKFETPGEHHLELRLLDVVANDGPIIENLMINVQDLDDHGCITIPGLQIRLDKPTKVVIQIRRKGNQAWTDGGSLLVRVPETMQ